MTTTDELVIIRDQGKCVRCGRHVAHLERGVAWSIHHRRPRGNGGTSLEWVGTTANLITLCGSGTTGCHGWVESNRDAARSDGFLVALNGSRVSADVPVVHALHGLVFLTDAGGWASARGGMEMFEDWSRA